MSDQDENQKSAFFIVGAVVAVIVAAVVTFGAWATLGKAPAGAPAATAAEEAPAAVGEALAKVYFELGNADISADAAAELAKVVAAAKAEPKRIALVSGFHDASGDAARNAEVSRQRAVAVRDWLVAQGIEDSRIKLSKPAETLGTGDAREARRVELRVQ
ncbi:OmpA family protein [Uliginosibacterium sp. H3]|uniref:OmpA family protein n=1 Tax=Uliginosibacterium silvisoli TaxID=3114758 RepID=A0ABU6K921_9RHOO|nr:OmpA family protein [Uliginosibacterium sp. H3]